MVTYLFVSGDYITIGFSTTSLVTKVYLSVILIMANHFSDIYLEKNRPKSGSKFSLHLVGLHLKLEETGRNADR